MTGGASGIGKAITRGFAEEGAQVAVLDVDRDAAKETDRTLEEEGGTVSFFECDVSDSDQVPATFDTVVDELGRLEVLINNAGIAHVGTVGETTEEDLDRLYEVNVKGVYNCLKAGVSETKEDGGQ